MPVSSADSRVADWAVEARDVWDRNQDAIRASKERMRSSADAHWRPAPTFAPGDLVWLCARNIRLRVESTKFAPRYLGPFKVLEQVNPVVYRLSLPPRLGITDTFHVSLLKPVYMSRFSESSAGTSGSSTDDYEVNAILGCKVVRGKKLYLVDWKGYGPEDRSWEPVEHIRAPQLIAAFERGEAQGGGVMLGVEFPLLHWGNLNPSPLRSPILLQPRWSLLSRDVDPSVSLSLTLCEELLLLFLLLLLKPVLGSDEWTFLDLSPAFLCLSMPRAGSPVGDRGSHAQNICGHTGENVDKRRRPFRVAALLRVSIISGNSFKTVGKPFPMSTNEQDCVRTLIEMYRSLPCLWKIKSKDYSNRYMKREAYEKLVAVYREYHPTETVDENIVRKKIQALRSFQKRGQQSGKF
ncbi:unnamed protein product [Ranitomeya imitator]|uniref:Chromo domain-containing protein n=1 Tax=Ranitomeya imitator TaxID=111125 RepID=A0ABN9MNR1_9NEOB|nr:unnamed protein product [Ranitomeya imitator]